MRLRSTAVQLPHCYDTTTVIRRQDCSTTTTRLWYDYDTTVVRLTRLRYDYGDTETRLRYDQDTTVVIRRHDFGTTTARLLYHEHTHAVQYDYNIGTANWGTIKIRLRRYQQPVLR